MSSSERPLFVAQLFQAYTASLEENKDFSCSPENLSSSMKILSNDEEGANERKPTNMADTTLNRKKITKRKERESIALSNADPPTSSVCLPERPGYHMLGNTIEAWDQISDIASEVAHSVMAKQASLVCEIGKRELTLNLLGARSSRANTKSRFNKRRKVGDDMGPSSLMRSSLTSSSNSIEPIAVMDSSGVVTSDDDEDDSSAEASTLSCLSSTSEGGGCEGSLQQSPGTMLVQHVERMGRLSNYIMEMEHCQRLIRAELESMEQEEGILF